MGIHHLNCGTMHPYGLPAADGTGGPFRRGHGVVHCLLVDTGDGLALVDTGWGRRDCANPTPAARQFMNLVGCVRDPSETAVEQVAALGYDPEDVRHIFMTHMHLDHAGGLPDFPAATVHLLAAEMEACVHPRTLMEQRAYLPEHREHGLIWQPHALQGDRWFGLDCTPVTKIGGTEVIMVPFTGHTRGHCGVALRVGERWLLHCGDAYISHHQVDPVQPYQYPNGRLIEALVTTGFRIRRRHWTRIRALLRAHGETIHAFCAHDAREFERYQVPSSPSATCC